MADRLPRVTGVGRPSHAEKTVSSCNMAKRGKMGRLGHVQYGLQRNFSLGFGATQRLNLAYGENGPGKAREKLRSLLIYMNCSLFPTYYYKPFPTSIFGVGKASHVVPRFPRQTPRLAGTIPRERA